MGASQKGKGERMSMLFVFLLIFAATMARLYLDIKNAPYMDDEENDIGMGKEEEGKDKRIG